MVAERVRARNFRRIRIGNPLLMNVWVGSAAGVHAATEKLRACMDVSA
jgi:hypothetical protein